MKKTVMIVKGAEVNDVLRKRYREFIESSLYKSLIISLPNNAEVEFRQFNVRIPITRRAKEFLVG